MNHRVFTRASMLIEKQLPDEFILVNGMTNELMALSPSGEAIWKLIDGHRSVEAIVNDVCLQFGIGERGRPEDEPPPETFGEVLTAGGESVGEQVGSFIGILADRGLVELVGSQ